MSAPPVCFSSSAMICDLSLVLRVGAWRMTGSFGSLFRIWLREVKALETESSEFVLAAAVYYGDGLAVVSDAVATEIVLNNAAPEVGGR